ncbi:MAG: CHAD domain-containing protein [Acidobacteriia bacterium]|nr:CHAD domain-containing protein [Terriglobia bacterium]
MVKVEWDEKADSLVNARTLLPKLVTNYFALGRELLAANPPPPELHALRLASKKLRYTLELFKSCYGPGFQARIDALKLLQQMLGEINDTVAAERTIGNMLVAETAESRRAVQSLRKRGEAKAQEFRKHWTAVFDAPGQERWWTEYLARQARGNHKK